MLNIFKYKKMYFNVCNDLANISLKLDSAESEIQNLKEQLEKNKIDFKNYREKSQQNYRWAVDNYEQIVQRKEKLRRKNSGKIGALKKKIKHQEEEHNKMMELINNLISENKELKQKRKKPNIHEIKRYCR